MIDMRNFLISASLLLLAPFVSISQDNDPVFEMIQSGTEEEILEMANVLMLDGFLYDSDRLIESLLNKSPENANYNYLKGYIVLYYEKDHRKSIKYFNKALKKMEGRVDLLKTDSDVPSDAYFHLGTAHHFLQEFDKAQEYYQLFHDNSFKRSVIYNLAEVRIEQCEVAKRLMNSPIKVDIVPMMPPINTQFPEYSPVISANGHELYFTSRREWEGVDQQNYMNPVDNSYPEDIFQSYLSRDEKWSDPVKLDMCRPLANEASVSLTANMDRLFVYSDSIGNGNIFFSEFSGKEYTSMQEIERKKMNTKHWETHFVISQDSNLIIFTSERKRGYGGRDLWKILRKSDGNWSKPINMGPGINSSEDEDSPFLTLDGSTLYYSTNGNKSMGGFDIMRSNLEMETWTEGKNLGYPINSTGDDIFYSRTYDGKDAYFSSFRLGGQGEKDIYHISYESPAGDNVIALEGGVLDLTDDAEEIILELELKNLTNNTIVKTVVKRNEFFEILDECSEYEITMKNTLNDAQLLTERLTTNCDNKPEYLSKFYYNGRYWIDGLLVDQDDKEVKINSANIELINSQTGELLENITGSENGIFRSSYFPDLIPGDSMNVSFRITAEGYLPGYFDLDTLLGNKGKISVSYDLIKQASEINLDDVLASYIIYYDFDKSNIRNSETDIMNKVVALMNENPSIQIKLESFTDCRGSESYNKILSERRALSSMNYIKERITNPERITSEGMGETNFVINCGCDEEKIHGNCSIKQHQKNRRTTFKLISAP